MKNIENTKPPHIYGILSNKYSINYLAKFQFWVLYWECHNTIATANKSKSRNSMQLTATAAAEAAANTNNSKWQMAFSGLKKKYFLFYTCGWISLSSLWDFFIRFGFAFSQRAAAQNSIPQKSANLIKSFVFITFDHL